jgi:hypothetical protein
MTDRQSQCDFDLIMRESKSLETRLQRNRLESSAVRSKLIQLRRRSEIDDSQRGLEVVNTILDGSTSLGAVTRQLLVKTADGEDLGRAVANCRVCEIAKAL